MADPAWLIALKLLAVVFLVGLNAFFVAAEFAIVKVRQSQVAAAKRAGDPRAKTADHVTKHLDAYLSACQLGITIASLGLGWIGEPAVAQLIEPLFIGAGITDPIALHTTSFIIAFSFITLLHIVYGELAPKTIAIRKPEETSLRLARPLHMFYVVFRPAINALNGLANRSVQLAGIAPPTGEERITSEAELREILAGAGTAPGAGRTATRARQLLNLMDLGGLKVQDIMTPVSRVVFLDARRPLDENIRLADDSGYSRYPLIDGSPDHVLGMVHYKDIFSRVIRKDRPEQTLGDVRRDILTAPETQLAENLLAEFIRRGLHMAVVVDEHGRTVGIVTMEDIFEEVFGNIRDEFDEPEQAYKTLAEGLYLVDGTMNLRDLESLMGKELRRPGVTTVSGLVIDALGRMPVPGEQVRVDGIDMTVRETGRRRVKSLEVRARSVVPAEAAPGTAEAAREHR
jgi:CBS domain containing-hemolysin-like protein